MDPAEGVDAVAAPEGVRDYYAFLSEWEEAIAGM